MNYEELALGYIQETLSLEERGQVHHLILTDPGFIATLRVELTLKEQLDRMKRPMPLALKQRVLEQVTSSDSREIAVLRILKTILENTVPIAVWPINYQLKRSVLNHE